MNIPKLGSLAVENQDSAGSRSLPPFLSAEARPFTVGRKPIPFFRLRSGSV